MARINVTGRALVITSEVKLDDWKSVQKYRGEALKLKEKDEDGNKKEVFRVMVDESGMGSVSNFGLCWGAADASGKATVTKLIPDNVEDVESYIVDTFGSVVMNVNKIEEAIPGAIEDAAKEREAILESVTIA